MANPVHLRSMAERMLAQALQNPHEELRRMLVVRASEYLDQALAMEAGQPSLSEAPQLVPKQSEDPQQNQKKK
jgi:hypothetical protein